MPRPAGHEPRHVRDAADPGPAAAQRSSGHGRSGAGRARRRPAGAALRSGGAYRARRAPRPDRGDLFFDFEGDPLYTEGDAKVWGIDYLFGWVDVHEQYSALWAHSFADERIALETFLDFIRVHRAQHPDFHIYHYAPYEPTHLLTMAARHGTREADVDRLLRDGVFVDLYPIVRRALRVGSRSYSIKKLEPLYMGEEVRTSDVQKGDDSIVRYVEARALRDDGAEAAAQEIFDDLADYNRYDCVSTRRLRDWLVDRAREAGFDPSPNLEPDERTYEPSPRAVALSRTRRPSWPDDVAESACLRLGRRGDRLLPARGQVLLGDAFPASARTAFAVGADAVTSWRWMPRGREWSRTGIDPTARASDARSSCAESWPPAPG